jgi:hypothetical protein
MILSEIDKVLRDIEAPFILLVMTVTMLFMNRKITRPSISHPLTTPLALVFMLLGFITMLSALIYQDRSIFLSLWKHNPVLYSFLYLLGAVFVVAVVVSIFFWKVMPKLWRRKQNDNV